MVCRTASSREFNSFHGIGETKALLQEKTILAVRMVKSLLEFEYSLFEYFLGGKNVLIVIQRLVLKPKLNID